MVNNEELNKGIDKSSCHEYLLYVQCTRQVYSKYLFNPDFLKNNLNI